MRWRRRSLPFARTGPAPILTNRKNCAGEGQFDVAVSLFSLQWINDLPGALVQIRRALKPDGLFVAALLGGGTLPNCARPSPMPKRNPRRYQSARVALCRCARSGRAACSVAGFALPVSDVERLTVRYRDFAGLARDLRAHGLTNVLTQRSRKPLRRDTLAALLAHYAQHHAEDGKLLARFETLYLTGWAPHESQQQPLKPGSAKSRLAEALGTGRAGHLKGVEDTRAGRRWTAWCRPR